MLGAYRTNSAQDRMLRAYIANMRSSSWPFAGLNLLM
jgi:hypothetical protein